MSKAEAAGSHRLVSHKGVTIDDLLDGVKSLFNASQPLPRQEIEMSITQKK